MMQNGDKIGSGSSDERWYEELISIQTPLLLSTLSLPESDTVLFRNFLERQTPPRLDRSQLPIEKIEKAIKQCQALLDKIIHNESQKAMRVLYEEKLTEVIRTQELLKAVHQDDDQGFATAQAGLFGTFDSENAVAAIGEIEDPRRVSDELMARGLAVFPTMSLPEANGSSYAAAEVAGLWNDSLSERPETMGWRAMVSDSHFRVTVAARPKLIHIPINARMSPAGIKRLFAHEVYAHITRREAGRNSKLKLLRIGTAGTHRIEEGLALMAEQVALNSNTYRGRDKYYALAVATGLFDQKPKNFFETFDHLSRYFKERFGVTKNDQKAGELALKHAWVHSRSIFRASDPESDQRHFTRGKIYLEGNIEAWSYLERSRDQEFQRLFTGRIKPEDYPFLDEL